MISDYQRRLREQFLSVPVVAPPVPWHPVPTGLIPIGGLLGIGFALAPDDGRDLVMVVSVDGHGLFDTVTGEKIACPGLGPIASTRVRIAGLFGGGLHTTTEDGWTLEVVSPEWPHDRVLLSADGGIPHSGPHGESWWHIFDSNYSELRAAGFSPSGRTLAVATSSDLTLWTRQAPDTERSAGQLGRSLAN